MERLQLVQLLLQPCQLGLALRIGDRQGATARGGIQGTGIGQLIQPGADAICFCRSALERIQTEGTGQLPKGLHLIQLSARASEGFRQHLSARGREPAGPALLLEHPGPLAQLPEPPGRTDPRFPIPQFMLDGPPHIGHRKRAEAAGAAPVKGLHRANQPLATHLDQIAIGQLADPRKASRHAVHQSEIGHHQAVAPMDPGAVIGAAGVGHQPAVVVLVQPTSIERGLPPQGPRRQVGGVRGAMENGRGSHGRRMNWPQVCQGARL